MEITLCAADGVGVIAISAQHGLHYDAALRLLPMLVRKPQEHRLVKVASTDIFAPLTAGVFRANAIAWVGGTYHRSDEQTVSTAHRAADAAFHGTARRAKRGATLDPRSAASTYGCARQHREDGQDAAITDLSGAKLRTRPFDFWCRNRLRGTGSRAAPDQRPAQPGGLKASDCRADVDGRARSDGRSRGSVRRQRTSIAALRPRGAWSSSLLASCPSFEKAKEGT
jgi:hypothetical protein